jgi:hypothetical protein
MDLNTGQWVVIIISALLILAYIRGYVYNRQQAEKILRWLFAGLKEWGKVAPGEKMPGMVTGGRLIVEPATRPVRKIEALYLLAPRENPLFWLFYRLQGKRDELIVWVTYYAAPGHALEAARKGDRKFASRLKATDKPVLQVVDAPEGLQAAYAAAGEAGLPDALRQFLAAHARELLQVSLRPNKPHLFLRADLRVVKRETGREFFEELGGLSS